MTTNPPYLSAIANVDADYVHYPKQAIALPDHDVVLPDAYLKWYEVREADDAIGDDVREQAHKFLHAEVASGDLAISGDLGFVIHHLCQGTFYFLIVCTWRNNNEMWETVYIRDTTRHDDLSLMEPGRHRETMCVWEMGVLVHEQQAWTRYLYSRRDDEAKLAYLDDRFTGTV
ncbi:hypothetical protein [Saccharothrix hoggarensis]|uniref:Uncharacterized protein n=1 Tax=Saccharothrix hoggarensis TaxID=913853 RepID=A0ABW3QPI6_9PSEU